MAIRPVKVLAIPTSLLLISTLVLLVAGPAVGAPPSDPVWTARYEDPRTDYGPEYHNVDICPDGNVAAAGSNYNPGGPGEMILCKYDQTGTALAGWPKMSTTAGMRWNEAQDVFVEPNGNITCGGYMITNANVWYLAVWRFDSSGAPLSNWPKYIKTDSHSFGTSAIVIDSGDIVTCGYSLYDSGGTWKYRLLLMRYHPDGTVAPGWPKTYQAVAGTDTIAYDLIQDSDGRLVIAGYEQTTATDRAALLYKMDTSGNVLAGWPKIYNRSAAWDEYSSVSQDTNGEYCLVGLTEGSEIGADEDSAKLMVTRYSKSGGQLISAGWPKVYGTPGIVSFHPPDVWHGDVDPSGNIVASFTRQSDRKVLTLKYARDGSIAFGFPKVFGRNGYKDETHATCSDAEGNIYTTGYSVSDADPAGDFTTFVVKYAPQLVWYLAEGSTGTNEFGSFETWILVQNPGEDSAHVKLFYQTPTGEVAGHDFTMAPHTRETRNVADFVANQFSVSTRVLSDRPVIAERAMYWTSNTGVYRRAATDSIGVTETATTWYLAEGSTGTNERGSFETWVLVQNPGDTTANVQLYYQTPAGEVEGHKITMAPHTRETRNVADFVANQFSVSTRVSSDRPVIAERAMYWTSNTGEYRNAADDSIGTSSPGKTWYLAEGSTGTSEFGSFETWVLVQNPGNTTANVQLYFQTPSGEVEGHKITMAPHTRETRNIADYVSNQFRVTTR
ncbi:MAG: hypothetical protein ACYC99_09680, partial [Candidatus Geothermincolia bacterium]